MKVCRRELTTAYIHNIFFIGSIINFCIFQPSWNHQLLYFLNRYKHKQPVKKAKTECLCQSPFVSTSVVAAEWLWAIRLKLNALRDFVASPCCDKYFASLLTLKKLDKLPLLVFVGKSFAGYINGKLIHSTINSLRSSINKINHFTTQFVLKVVYNYILNYSSTEYMLQVQPFSLSLNSKIRL